MCEVNWLALAIVSATISGPILAVWASEIRQQRRQATNRKEWVFRTLMTTRSTRLSDGIAGMACILGYFTDTVTVYPIGRSNMFILIHPKHPFTSLLMGFANHIQ